LDHALSAVRDCLFNIFAATLRIWRHSPHPQPENAPWTHLTWIQDIHLIITEKVEAAVTA